MYVVQEQKQMELLVSSELKKPVEDMRLRDAKVSVTANQSTSVLAVAGLPTIMDFP